MGILTAGTLKGTQEEVQQIIVHTKFAKGTKRVLSLSFYGIVCNMTGFSESDAEATPSQFVHCMTDNQFCCSSDLIFLVR